ncbi:MAG: SH3 domain-containing protein, partial [Mailhella sp.]|nr:SH3 domain-containing protein [Mailhella sp.]
HIPQALSHFAKRDPNTPLRTEGSSDMDYRHFRKLFFSAWNQSKPDSRGISDLSGILNRRNRGYAENLRPWAEKAWNDMRRNADYAHCPSMSRHAVTVERTDLRAAPTLRPRFAQITGAGQGFPFDDFQESALPPGLPVVAWHISRDGAWVFVESAIACGWVQARNIAWTDAAFEKKWSSAPLMSFIREDVALSHSGVYLCRADIGTVLPSAGEGRVLVPHRRLDGMADAVEVSVPADSVGPMPMKLTSGSVAAIGDRMMGEPYGWGGLFGNRDCSAMMRDLFTPFGIWLPRNSAAQAKAGAFTSLEKTADSARPAVISGGAVPFRTLLWLKGHIGLYVGEYQGEPVFFHNLWGVRNTLPDGKEGRIVVGRAVITGLRPGQEREDMRSGSFLVSRLRGFTTIGDR